MKIVINRSWGGFRLPSELSHLDNGDWRNYKPVRTNTELVKWAETHTSDLVVVDIPDTATDWVLNEYDGMETVYYVVDGKIKIA